MSYIGIVGHEAAKFTEKGEREARAIIWQLLLPPYATLVSGHCHLGGIDIWAEEEADKLGREKKIFPPQHLQWSPGYKERNLQIVSASTTLHCIAVVRLASSYRGMKFSTCYHCNATDHVKGGGCWTMKHAKRLHKPTQLHKVANEE